VGDVDDARWQTDDGRWKLSSVRSCWQKGEEKSMRMRQAGIAERRVRCLVVGCFVLRSSQRLFLNRSLACFLCLIAR
jgi:nuclear transport factor 2 (NTF2) superfamily protein